VFPVVSRGGQEALLQQLLELATDEQDYVVE